MANLLGPARNGFIFCVYVYSLAYNLRHVSVRGEGVLEYRGYGGKFKYLTFLCFVSVAVCLLLNVIECLLCGWSLGKTVYL